MPEERINHIPNAVTKTLICVDAYKDFDYSGMLYNLYLPEPVAFGQVKDIIHALETFFDDIAYPQPYFEWRSFSQAQSEPQRRATVIPELYQSDTAFFHRGRLATFMVEVSQRQNASWQGSIRWLERDLQRSFQSTLQFLMLLDSAVRQSPFCA